MPIRFAEAIPIACLGLAVNIASAWLLGGGDHDHHRHEHDDDDHHHIHHGARRDNNIRAAIIHVTADAAVSILVITGLLLARTFGWLWMDPLAGMIGAIVIASWSYGLVRDTSAILLDMTPDAALPHSLRELIEQDGDRISDLHLWRLGPGHLGVILAITTEQSRDHRFYREKLAGFPALSHVTIEIERTVARAS